MSSTRESSHPFIQALPPATDYLTFLTLIEYNLDKESLPVLFEVLADVSLTENIGWDLVFLLLPLLPESKPCLDRVSHLGNPREVILKLTEFLEGLSCGRPRSREHEASSEDESSSSSSERGDQTARSRAAELQDALCDDVLKGAQYRQFTTVLDLLAILHGRLCTKVPSKFLSGTLKSVLSAYTNCFAGHTQSTRALIQFATAFNQSRGPSLPSRSAPSPGTDQVRPCKTPGKISMPDPEAELGHHDTNELAIQRKLLQSFLTYVLEIYYTSYIALNAGSICEIAWTKRYSEMRQAHTSITDKPQTPKNCPKLEQRDELLRNFLSSSYEIQLDLKAAYQSTILSKSPHAETLSESEFPSSPDQVPLSALGILFMISEHLFLHKSERRELPPGLQSLSVNELAMTWLNLAPEASNMLAPQTCPIELDALLLLGFFIVDNPSKIWNISRNLFLKFMRQLTFLTSQNPNTEQRYQMHLLTGEILHQQPDDAVRLEYIKEMLGQQFYENVRTGAIDHLKNEIIYANDQTGVNSNLGTGESMSLFRSPHLIESLADLLWPTDAELEISQDDLAPSGPEKLLARLPFYIALVNMILFLITNEIVFRRLDISRFYHDLDSRLLKPLTSKIGRIHHIQARGPSLSEENERGQHSETVAVAKDDHFELEILSLAISTVRERWTARSGSD